MPADPVKGALATQEYQNPYSNSNSLASRLDIGDDTSTSVHPESQTALPATIVANGQVPLAATAASSAAQPQPPGDAVKAGSSAQPHQLGAVDTSAITEQPLLSSGANTAPVAACTEPATASGTHQYASVESLGLSTTAATATSSTETVSSGTHTPASPPTSGEASRAAVPAAHVVGITSDGNTAAMASFEYVDNGVQPPPPIVLIPGIHGFDCECGELSLRNDEAHVLQSFLLQRSWRLVPCPVPARKGGSSKNSKSRVRPSRRLAQELEALQSACDSTAFELGRRRQKRASTRYEDLGDERKSSRMRGGSPGADPSVASVRSGGASAVSQPRTRSRGTRNCGTGGGQGEATESAAYEGADSRSLRRRRYVNGDDTQSLNSDVCADGGDAVAGAAGKQPPRRILASTRWRDSCMAILQHLKSLKAAQWFLYPVDPEADNVPDYFDVVQHPMDLQTVEKKLLQGAYQHPFLWQQDVRQVFFNAFSYHVMSNDVWKDATALALEFERCCKQVDEVNPYAEVVSDSDELAASLQTNRPLESLQLSASSSQAVAATVGFDGAWGGGSIQQQPPLEPAVAAAKDRRALPPPLSTMDNTTCASSLHQQYHDEHTSYSPSGGGGLAPGGATGRTRSRARTRTQRQAMDADDGLYDEYSSGRSSRKLPAANSSPRRGRGRGRGARGSSAMMGRQGSWDASGGSSHQSAYGGGVAESFQTFEPPADGVVLPPPPVQRIGVNDKPLSSSQRRTLEHHMTMLSPEQRRAALELIQDDLGILAADHMCDSTFSFDTELLSIEKQKRLFAYVNSMVRANRELLMSRGLLGNPLGEAQGAVAAHLSAQNGGGVEATGQGAAGSTEPRDAARYDSDSSSSDSDSDSSSSSDSLSSSTSSSDSDSDDGDSRPCPPPGGHPTQQQSSAGSTGAHHLPAGGTPSGAGGSGGGGGAGGSGFADGGGHDSVRSNAEAPGADEGGIPGSLSMQKGLPEYRPVAEDGEKVQIREELMGRHADFLGVIDSQQADEAMASAPQEAKATAWQEWKGQVIQQGFAAERAVAPQRSASEIIAEGYDARI
ncbi:hypothetical protein Esti_000482 [Eimeria stiedai]